ncbi:MAG: hypothetical protein AMXMBFR33_01590 [Candidatus Xenobia bacterium]
MSIQPVETEYNGYRFRSRLEARWAVFFDTLGIRYQYEPEGFVIDAYEDEKPRKYLPDFYIPTTKTWVEVKGEEQRLDYQLLFDLVEYGGHLPDVADGYRSLRGLLVLGPIPSTKPERGGQEQLPIHPLVQHHKGVLHSKIYFVQGGMVLQSDGYPCGGARDLAVYELIGDQEYCEVPMSSAVRDAYSKARKARFEHGETPS